MNLPPTGTVDLPPERAKLPAATPASVRGRLGSLLQSHFVFPVLGLVALAAVWAVTFNLIDFEQSSARAAAESTALELANTYEAQILRNLRELDNTVKVVKYFYESSGDPLLLRKLRDRQLLPPEMLFRVQLFDADGLLLMSTARHGDRQSRIDFEPEQSGQDLWISRPRLDEQEGTTKLDFSRRLRAPDGSFAGIVMVSVDASYFVSGYEGARLGADGVLGLAGTSDGIFRIRRTGDAEATGGSLGDEALLARASTENAIVVREPSAWDGVPRFTAIKPLYAFPLTLVVGVSEAEQLATTAANARLYLWRAAIASALLLLVTGVLTHTSWKLVQTARRENEAKIAHEEYVRYLAYHDGLTGLPNRHYFSKMLEHAIAEARRYERSLALLFLDLDRFKHINDTLGHQAGDLMLQEMALRLRSCLRESDLLARLGGDEFVVLLLEYDIKKYATTVAQKLLRVVSEPLPLQDQNLVGTSSIGIAVYPLDAQDEQTLMKRADTAMYHAKSQGRNNFQFYSSELRMSSLSRLRLETSLRQAIRARELQLHYQPKIDSRSGVMTGMEALLRWHSAEHGTVSPVDFIPIAEDTGLIVDIGKWALEEACAQNVEWLQAGFPPMCVAVNLSARQFNDPDLVDDVAAILDRTGLPPHLLELEITESMLMHSIEKAIRTMNTLNEIGVKLAIDDFGTGYSSLSYLRRFPIDTLKIDRSFVTLLHTNSEDRVITSAIINMAKALQLNVVAEGVESSEQAAILLQQGCDQYQGYHFSKPLPAEAFTEFLARSVRTAPDGRSHPLAVDAGKSAPALPSSPHDHGASDAI